MSPMLSLLGRLENGAKVQRRRYCGRVLAHQVVAKLVVVAPLNHDPAAIRQGLEMFTLAKPA